MRHVRITLALMVAVIAGMLLVEPIKAQLQQSGGPGSTVTANAGTNLNTSALALDSTVAKDATLTTIDTDLKANIVLKAGTNIIGKAGIDQTTPGTTNGVAVTQIGANTVLTGNGVTGTGSQRVTIASDQTAFSVNAAQSGTWTMQPGNTANTTPWFVKNIPLHGCAGNTLDDVTSVDVATSTGTAVTATDTCVFQIYANNKTGTAATLTIQDTSGTPIVYSTTFSIPANSDVIRNFMGHKFLGGVKLIAGTSSAINAITTGVH